MRDIVPMACTRVRGVADILPTAELCFVLLLAVSTYDLRPVCQWYYSSGIYGEYTVLRMCAPWGAKARCCPDVNSCVMPV